MGNQLNAQCCFEGDLDHTDIQLADAGSNVYELELRSPFGQPIVSIPVLEAEYSSDVADDSSGPDDSHRLVQPTRVLAEHGAQDQRRRAASWDETKTRCYYIGEAGQPDAVESSYPCLEFHLPMNDGDDEPATPEEIPEKPCQPGSGEEEPGVLDVGMAASPETPRQLADMPPREDNTSEEEFAALDGGMAVTTEMPRWPGSGEEEPVVIDAGMAATLETPRRPGNEEEEPAALDTGMAATPEKPCRPGSGEEEPIVVDADMAATPEKPQAGSGEEESFVSDVGAGCTGEESCWPNNEEEKCSSGESTDTPRCPLVLLRKSQRNSFEKMYGEGASDGPRLAQHCLAGAHEAQCLPLSAKLRSLADVVDAMSGADAMVAAFNAKLKEGGSPTDTSQFGEFFAQLADVAASGQTHPPQAALGGVSRTSSGASPESVEANALTEASQLMEVAFALKEPTKDCTPEREDSTEMPPIHCDHNVNLAHECLSPCEHRMRIFSSNFATAIARMVSPRAPSVVSMSPLAPSVASMSDDEFGDEQFARQVTSRSEVSMVSVDEFGDERIALQLSMPSMASLSADELEDQVAQLMIPGVTVELRSLRSAPHLNGQRGTFQGWGHKKGMVVVRLKTGQLKALKQSNVFVVDSFDSDGQLHSDNSGSVESSGRSSADSDSDAEDRENDFANGNRLPGTSQSGVTTGPKSSEKTASALAEE